MLSLLAHPAPQAWKPAPHVKVHWLPAQLVVPLSTAVHALLHPPQWLALVWRSTHCLPHSVGAAAVQPVVQTKPLTAGEQLGAPAGQTALHAPQCVAWERSVS